ncbi:efflux RND transporter permease subunit [Shewanella yunxiaonensis]|uniref:Efflux RND transporter permease subunit n=1 Tax=Shewanella yunxiaonensis TaxID=2829809 RepID=A0ABX7YRR5_9GAMM|nr:efflux RND transporter permease subunit [Shewanella yunxiaonensis]QUN05427.1 efflux RND transporter permease subunit [Shewanella yunxiaonensis]
MNFSRLFIFRPVATWLLTMALIMAGVLGFRLLPVSTLPSVSFPVIVVSASLAGASPKTMAATVATPLERALGQIAGVNEMTSSSSQGTTSIVLQFDLNRDIDGAARDVQAAINAARSLLPSSMPNLPTYRKMNPSSAPVMMLALTSDKQTAAELYDFAASNLETRISQVQGVGSVSIFGSSLPAVRGDLHPQALTHYGISLDTVRQAITNATSHGPKGIIQTERYAWAINSNDQLQDAADYKKLVITYVNGAAIHLGDVADVYNGVQDEYNIGYYNGKPAINIAVMLASGANMLATIDTVKAQLPLFQKLLPEQTQLVVSMDRSPTIRSSLHETENTLIIAVCLVIAVVFVFLRNGRALLIPALALPISIIGTFAVMYLLGYSLDNLSLMALIVATGFVVDDAIVVLENVSRHLEAGYGPVRAALRGSKEVGFTVLSMTLSLVAVFIPLLLMGGIVGRLFREFAVTLTVSLLISMLVSLTLTPMLCSRILRRQTLSSTPNRLYRAIERFLAAMHRGYQTSLHFVLKHRRLTLLSLLITIMFNFYLYAVVQKGFFPTQDTGIIFGSLRSDQSTSFAMMKPRLKKYSEMIQSDPAVASVMGSIGSGRHGSRNEARFFIRLKPYSERTASASEVANRLYQKALQYADGRLFLRAASDLRFGGRSADASYQLSLQADDLDLLEIWAPKVQDALSALPELSGVDSDLKVGGQEVRLVIDRDAAKQQGISVRDLDMLLNNSFSQRQVATLYQSLNQYYVVMGLTKDYTGDSEVLQNMHIVNSSGDVIPISAFTHVVSGNAPLAVAHQGHSATVTIAFNTNDGYTLAQAQQAIQTALQKIALPTTVAASYAGNAQMAQSFISNIPLLILAALVAVYIVLGMLYESYVQPLTILSTLPSAGIGALILMQLTSTPLTVVALIGILLLIGIVKKNAIMMIDFALDAQRSKGLTAEEAIFEACIKRFRPILMTSLAAFFGALPMALDSGGDADLRRPLGIAICGGLVISQILTLYTTPVVYLYMDRMSQASRRLWHRIIRRDNGTREPMHLGE